MLGQSHLNSAEYLEKVVVIPARFLPFGTGADFGQLVVLQDIEGDVPQHPEVLGGVAFAYPAFVFPECDVQHQVQ